MMQWLNHVVCRGPARKLSHARQKTRRVCARRPQESIHGEEWRKSVWFFVFFCLLSGFELIRRVEGEGHRPGHGDDVHTHKNSRARHTLDLMTRPGTAEFLRGLLGRRVPFWGFDGCLFVFGPAGAREIYSRRSLAMCPAINHAGSARATP